MTNNTKSLRELEQLQQNLEYQKYTLRVFVADIMPFSDGDPDSMDYRLAELENLIDTYGGIVILQKIQQKWAPDYNYYMWSGKLDEIVQEMKESKANLLILWGMLKPSQIHNINEKLAPIWAKAWDRVDLILKIFEKNAKTIESRLQIELASIKHMWTRIFDMSEELGSQGRWWNKWSRWKWETNTEVMKRHLKDREISIKKELEKFKKVRAEHRKSRAKKWLNTIGIVWYTNAWKSSLMNVLTGKWVLEEDRLFATLGTTVWSMYIAWEYDGEANTYSKPKELLISDTIWFIQDLPPKLIQAFTSTLEDSIESDLLLHVIDASDARVMDKIQVVEDILSDIHADQERIYVFNKIDKISQDRVREIYDEFIDLNPILISTYTWKWLDKLKDVLERRFN